MDEALAPRGARCCDVVTRDIPVMRSINIRHGPEGPTEMNICPACGGASTSKLFEVTADQASRNFVSPRQYPDRFRNLTLHLSQLWGRDTCDVRNARIADLVLRIRSSPAAPNFITWPRRTLLIPA
jgi:hypothetical protein